LIVDTNALSAILDGEPTIAAVFERRDVLVDSRHHLGEYRSGSRNPRGRANKKIATAKPATLPSLAIN